MPGPLPLLGLRAFAEAGRTGSIKAASHRLGVTAGAVSQQVKLLEARLGVTLFERHHRELRLTPAGQRLLPDLANAFACIERAVENLEQERAHRGVPLVVSTTAAFAATWLVPRLGRFVATHTRVEVQIQTTAELAQVGTGPGSADLAIRHGLGNWPGLEALRLLQPRLVPVGSPRLLTTGPPIRQPSDCLGYPLLHDALGADWPLWLQAVGGDYRDPRVRQGTRFSDGTLLVRAAAAGQGLALVRDTYVADEIASGRLAVALDTPWPAQFAYYVVTRPRAGRLPAHVTSFRDWLLEEAASPGDCTRPGTAAPRSPAKPPPQQGSMVHEPHDKDKQQQSGSLE